MSVSDQTGADLHRIRVELYPNNKPRSKGAYLARTANDTVLDIEQVCAALRDRNDLAGKDGDLALQVRQFFDEAARQLCNGNGVNMGYFSIHPEVGGSFESPQEPLGLKPRRVSFRFRALSPMKTMAKGIVLEHVGDGDPSGSIDEVADLHTGAVNSKLTPGGGFAILGWKIKIAGKDPAVGVYFAAQDNSGREYKAKCLPLETTRHRVDGIVPNLERGLWKIRIRTQYTGAGISNLKKPRTLESGFTLSVD